MISYIDMYNLYQPVSTCYNLLQKYTEYTANCKPYSFKQTPQWKQVSGNVRICLMDLTLCPVLQKNWCSLLRSPYNDVLSMLSVNLWRKCLLSMLIVVEQGGIAPGGNNFDCKLRRESTDIEDGVAPIVLWRSAFSEVSQVSPFGQSVRKN